MKVKHARRRKARIGGGVSLKGGYVNGRWGLSYDKRRGKRSFLSQKRVWGRGEGVEGNKKSGDLVKKLGMSEKKQNIQTYSKGKAEGKEPKHGHREAS